LTMKKMRGKTSAGRAVKIETKEQPSNDGATSAEAELTPDHAEIRRLLGQVADGLDSLQHHLNVFQRAVTASGHGARAKGAPKASKVRARAVEQAP